MAHAEQIAVPETRELASFGDATYTDAFVAEVPDPCSRTAEEWARRMLEEAPLPVRRSLRAGWFSLGLKHGPLDSRDHVLGWEIRESTPDFVRLGGDSRLGMPAELLLQRRDDSLLFCTVIRHENPFVRAMWAPIVPGHEQVVKRLLEQAARKEWAILDSAQEPRPYPRCMANPKNA
jgi:hypothetical protein